jgi:hypothetical protein
VRFTAIEDDNSGLPPQPIGTGSFMKVGDHWQIEADYSPIGATRQTVLVYNGDNIVGVSQEHEGPAALAHKPPDDWHWTVAPGGARIMHGCTGTWKTPVELEIVTQNREVMHLTADSIKMIPEDDTMENAEITFIEMTAASIPPGITFTNMTVHPTGCCQDRGNADGVVGPGGPVDVADLTYLVAYLFQAGPIPPCVDEGNVDGVIGPGGPIDVADLTFLVAYLFQGGPTPPPC